jgi:hypothetical protein
VFNPSDFAITKESPGPEDFNNKNTLLQRSALFSSAIINDEKKNEEE